MHGPSSVLNQKAQFPRSTFTNPQQNQPVTAPEKPGYRQTKLPALYTPAANRYNSFSAPKPGGYSKPENTPQPVQVHPVSSYAGLSKQKNQSLWVRGASKAADADDDDEMEIDLTARRKRVSLSIFQLTILCVKVLVIVIQEGMPSSADDIEIQTLR